MATAITGLNGTIKTAIEELQTKVPDVTPSGKFLKDDGTWAAAGGGSFSGDMDDIPDGTTYVKTENNYTDADAAKVAATSGTNTGDNATNTLYSGLAASKLDATAFSGLAKITVGTSTPGSPSLGDLWIDTN
jgi:hypothetical protein